MDMYQDVKDYYDEYKTEGSGLKIYSTWSILNFLEKKVLKDYWVDTAGLEDLDELFLQGRVRQLVTQLPTSR